MNDRQKIVLVMIKMDDTTPLPNQESDFSDSGTDYGLTTTYVIRMTPHDKFTMDQLKEYIHKEPSFCKYVLAQETVPRPHYHLVVTTDVSFEIEDVRGTIKAFLIPFWVKDDLKLPRGFGNKQYNLQVAEDVDLAISYALKESNLYVYEGYSADYIQQRKEASFQKKSPSSLR